MTRFYFLFFYLVFLCCFEWWNKYEAGLKKRSENIWRKNSIQMISGGICCSMNLRQIKHWTNNSFFSLFSHSDTFLSGATGIYFYFIYFSEENIHPNPNQWKMRNFIISEKKASRFVFYYSWRFIAWPERINNKVSLERKIFSEYPQGKLLERFSFRKTVLFTLLCFRRCSKTKGNKFVRLNLGSDRAQQKHATNNNAAQQVSRYDDMGSFEEMSLIKDLGCSLKAFCCTRINGNWISSFRGRD